MMMMMMMGEATDEEESKKRWGTKVEPRISSSFPRHAWTPTTTRPLPIPMMLTVTPFELTALYDPEGVADGDSLRTMARGPTGVAPDPRTVELAVIPMVICCGVCRVFLSRSCILIR